MQYNYIVTVFDTDMKDQTHFLWWVSPPFTDGSSEENSDVLSSCRQSVIQPLTYGLDGLDLEVVRSGVTFPGKDVLENAIEEYSVQASELKKQLNEVSLSPAGLLFCYLCG